MIFGRFFFLLMFLTCTVWAMPLVAQSFRIGDVQEIGRVHGGFSGKLTVSGLIGRDVVPIGDLDGDGVIDIAMTVDHGGSGSIQNELWILFLQSDGTVKTQQRLNDSALFGSRSRLLVTSLGDLDGDGAVDLAVGRAGADGIWILFLNRDGTLREYRQIDVSVDSDVTAIGDLDGDGVVDLAVGDREASGGFYRGLVWIVFLNADGAIKSTRELRAGVNSWISFVASGIGSMIAPIGDIDGDGVIDLAVGRWNELNDLWLFYMNSDGTIKSQKSISQDLYGNVGIKRLVQALGNVGDLDGNSIDDLGLVFDAESIWILRMGGGGTVISYQEIAITSEDISRIKDLSGDRVNAAINGIGDLNGDNSLDIIIGLKQGSKIFGSLLILMQNQSELPVISVRDTSAKHGSVMKVPVDLYNVADREIDALDLTLSFPRDHLDFSHLSLSSELLTGGWDSSFATSEDHEEGTEVLTISLTKGNEPLREDTRLFELHLALAENRDLTTANIFVESAVANDGIQQIYRAHGSIRWTGVDGVISIESPALTVGDSIAVSILDADEDRDPEKADTLIIRAELSDFYGDIKDDIEFFTAVETQPNSGRFIGKLSSVFSRSGSYEVGDGVLQIRSQSWVAFNYEDAMDVEGTIRDRGVSQRTGGTDGSISVSPDRFVIDDTLTVTVVEYDEGRPWGIDRLRVPVYRDGDINEIGLVETGLNTGIFEGKIETLPVGGDISGQNTALSFPDSAIALAVEDAISVCYTDPVNLAGERGQKLCDTSLVGLAGADGRLQASVVSEPGDTLWVRVVDRDLNSERLLELGGINFRTNERETVLLSKVADGDSVYLGAIRSQIDAGAPIDHDGVFNTVGGDVISFTYFDELTSRADAVEVGVSHQVIRSFGDVDHNGEVRAVDAVRIISHVLRPSLRGLDSLAANVDRAAPYSSISLEDASLVMKARVQRWDRFPVQGADAANHSQTEIGVGAAKRAVEDCAVWLEQREEYWAVVSRGCGGIINGDLRIWGIRGRSELPEVMGDFLVGYQETEEGLRIVFAGPNPIAEVAELAWIYPEAQSETVQLVQARFNEGQVIGRIVDSPNPVSRVMLYPNIPNPFNPETAIRFGLPSDLWVRLRVYDTLGRRVHTLVEGEYLAGEYEVVWDGRDEASDQVASGVYFYRLETRLGQFIGRMLLLK